MTDQEREERISFYAQRINEYFSAGRNDLAYESNKKMCALIKGRSKSQVMKMEREKGLV